MWVTHLRHEMRTSEYVSFTGLFSDISMSLLQVSFQMFNSLWTFVWRAAALVALICYHICNAYE